MGDNIINWQIKEYNKMEKTFREVIADIKEGEVWEGKFDKISMDQIGCIFFNDGKEPASPYIHVEEMFYLKTQYTFEEAFKAYEEGKEIESCVNGYKYGKHTPGKLFLSDDLFGTTKESEKCTSLSIEQVRNKWYING